MVLQPHVEGNGKEGQKKYEKHENSLWTVVDCGTEVRGPLFFHTWTVVDRTFC